MKALKLNRTPKLCQSLYEDIKHMIFPTHKAYQVLDDLSQVELLTYFPVRKDLGNGTSELYLLCNRIRVNKDEANKPKTKNDFRNATLRAMLFYDTSSLDKSVNDYLRIYVGTYQNSINNNHDVLPNMEIVLRYQDIYIYDK